MATAATTKKTTKKTTTKPAAGGVEETVQPRKVINIVPVEKSESSFLFKFLTVVLILVLLNFGYKYAKPEYDNIKFGIAKIDLIEKKVNAVDDELDKLKEETKKASATTDMVQIIEAKPYYLRAKRDNGQIELRTGGNSSWRYNNPGKLLYGDFAKSFNAIGSDGKHAMFPTYDTGRKALEALLFTTAEYKNLTIAEAAKKFAAAKDGYNPSAYAKNMASAARAKTTTKLAEVSPQNRQKMIDSIQKMENYAEGRTIIFDDEKDWEVRGW